VYFLLALTAVAGRYPTPGGTMHRKYTMPMLRRGQVSAAILAMRTGRPSSLGSLTQQTRQCLARATLSSPNCQQRGMLYGIKTLISGATNKDYIRFSAIALNRLILFLIR
jgi:hypothetical protein